MSIIVQKFGGTSVADGDKIRAAARKAIRACQQGHQVVMVVSAMGKNTDALIDLARQIHDRPPAREMDMLLSTGEQVSVALMAMAIDALGHRAVSLTGAQIGIRTDSRHTKARIRSISTERMRQHLNEGKIVIAAGFQGIDEDFNITTLGRGGSDTTAVALAAVLGATACEIYTDVDGVYTTDPRVVPEARKLDQISYDEMLELASLGAGVMHSRSIEFAKKYAVPVHVRSSFTDTRGTMIMDVGDYTSNPVTGAALTSSEARVTLQGVPDVPGTSLEIFSRIASRNVSVDMIVQNVAEDGVAEVSFTVPSHELHETLDASADAVRALGGGQVLHNDQLAKISVVGRGMAQQSGVAHRMFAALAEVEANMHMITTSEIKISALVGRDRAQHALRAVHAAFQLERAPAGELIALEQLAEPTAAREADAVDVVESLRGVDMEQLLVDAIELDQQQGRVTIHGLPDTPGVAAQLFRQVAEAGLFVDMIVQSYGSHGATNLSFTVPRSEVARSVSIVHQLAEKYRWKQVSSSPHVAKLSVSGVGLRSHTDVAIRMFRTLASRGINLQMISTSEVRVNVVVDAAQGEAGLAGLQEAFEDVRRTMP